MCNTGCCSLCNLKLVKQYKAQTFYRVSQAFAFHGDVGFKETFQQNFLRMKQKTLRSHAQLRRVINVKEMFPLIQYINLTRKNLAIPTQLMKYVYVPAVCNCTLHTSLNAVLLYQQILIRKRKPKTQRGVVDPERYLTILT